MAASIGSRMNHERLTERIGDMLCPAFHSLYEAGKNRGHWEEPRATALAAICLQLVSDRKTRWIESVEKWIIGQQHDPGGDWGDEVWDSAMSLLALRTLGVPPTHVAMKRGVRWLRSVLHRNPRDNSWHDEPWETCWALMALLSVDRQTDAQDFERAILWLIDRQDQQGRLVAAHYTGYLLLIEMLAKPAAISADTRAKLSEAATQGCSYLIDDVRRASDGALWTGEAWSNGQILWTLSESDRPTPAATVEIAEKAIQWFEKSQEPNGRWTDIEDTASAILGLYSLQARLIADQSQGRKSFDDAKNDIRVRLRQSVTVPRLDTGRPLFEVNEESGYYHINLRIGTVRIAYYVLSFILVGLLGWLATVMDLWERLWP